MEMRRGYHARVVAKEESTGRVGLHFLWLLRQSDYREYGFACAVKYHLRERVGSGVTQQSVPQLEESPHATR